MIDARLSPNGLRIKRVAGWSAFILILITQANLPFWPLFSLSFFVCATTWQFLDSRYEPNPGKTIVVVGGLLNGIALFANGGRMPVLGRAETSRWWKPLTEDSRVPWLCDVYFMFSIGDMIILAGVITAIVVAIARRKTVRESSGVPA